MKRGNSNNVVFEPHTNLLLQFRCLQFVNRKTVTFLEVVICLRRNGLLFKLTG